MTTTPYPNFLESELPPASPETAAFHVIPVPFEKSVSYGTGTADGPSAILRASQELEAFDGTGIPGEAGIYTAPAIDCGSVDEMVDAVAIAVSTALNRGNFPVVLGGEHTVSTGAFQALAARPERIGVVQLDAHADLRDTYQGSRHSHACVMHRALDMGLPIYQVGVRSLSFPEHQLRRERGIGHFDAERLHERGISAFTLPDGFPETVYVTFDVDAFDPSIMPSTGTPEPGGLSWYDAVAIIKAIAATRTIVGFDCVELAPVKGVHHPDFTVAKLIHVMMGLLARP